MTSCYLDIHNAKRLRATIDKKANDLFKSVEGRPQLQVYRRFKKENPTGEDTICVRVKEEIKDAAQIKNFQLDSSNSSQFFFIRQNRSWTTLNISRALFEDFLSTYGIFSHVWKFMFTFGRKSEENEFSFPAFRARRCRLRGTDAREVYECAYILRRAELNNRVLTEGQSPWSIRQTGVYHQFGTTGDPSDCHTVQESQSTFLFVAASPSFEDGFSESLVLSKEDERAIAPWNVHRLLVADSLKGWIEYETWIEEELREQSDRIVVAQVGTDKENLPPLTNFNISFIDRQNLKLLEDSVLDLQVILSTLMSTITGISEQCKSWCQRYHTGLNKNCDCDLMIEEFREHIRDVEIHVQRADALKDRAKSTAQLLSDLLSYEDAIALKDLAQESQKESQAMFFLTKISTRDAAAVKVLTIISLIYLPTTIIENFFSTEFVHTDVNGSIAVVSNVWLLAALAGPLTAFTIAMWWIWTHLTKKNLGKNLLAPTASQVRRRNCSQRILSWRRARTANDEEKGGLGEERKMSQFQTLPESFGIKAQGTWSSTETTIK